ncbi:cell wall-binding repeat-containing protein [Clostridium coskatii]|uniref:Amidase enhancer n=1 Tax=Clostridium coskatii TaxID=1705578 RepID=A0A166TLW6_9CLOT|nr:cell wall-binding repeat-containing protein [Clostridium coskatii]OAA93851.1 Amidase enhancer precursor [Clostridium coskatii]OBR95179.1 amidase enhancer precursor [Clostridium coskatii]
MKRNKLLTLIISVSLAATALGTTLDSTTVKAAGQVNRTSGQDRYETAAKVAKSNWSTSDNVVLVSGEGYADAVSASVLAKKLDAPILLTTSKTLDSCAKSAISTLKPKNIYIVGGNASISKDIRDSLKSSYSVTELGGEDRYETNAAVAGKLVDLGVDPTNAILVGGQGFSDALTAASIAASKGEILLLGNNDLDSIKPIESFVSSHKSKVTVIGTNFVINDDTYKAVNGINRVDGGKDRFDTNLKVLGTFKDDIKTSKAYVANASGDGYADALVASVLAGKDNAPLVLVDSENSKSTENAIDYLKSEGTSLSDVEVLGGTSVVSGNIISKISAIIASNNGGSQSNQTYTGYITTEDDFATSLGEDTADMIYMKLMAQSGLGITFQKDGKWVFYYFDGNIATNNTSGADGKWTFDGTGSQLNAWNLVKAQVEAGNPQSPVPVTVAGTLKGNTQTNPGPDADNIEYPVITANSITVNK